VSGAGGVLWVTAEPPDFGVGGGAVRQAQMLRALRRVFDPVDLVVVGAVEDDEVRAAVDAMQELAASPRRPSSSATRRRLRDLARVAARVPAEVADRRSERAVLRAALSAGAPLRRYSVVHVEHLGLAGVVPAAFDGLRSLDIQNVPSRMAEQARTTAPGSRQRWLLEREAAAAARFQRRAVGSVDVVSVVSAADAADLGLASGTGRPRVLVVPNGVDPDAFASAAGPLPVAPNVVFTGTLDYLPNVDGIVWFTEEVWPRVIQRVPAARLSIVGRRPVGEVRRLTDAGRGVSLHPDVPDTQPFLAAARAAVVPIRIGSGSRVKALEAMASGRPVAATTVGLEGIEVSAGVHALVGDAPGQLAAAVVRLLEDDATAEQVGAAGRALVESRYAWESIGSRYALELSEIVRTGSPE